MTTAPTIAAPDRGPDPLVSPVALICAVVAIVLLVIVAMTVVTNRDDAAPTKVAVGSGTTFPAPTAGGPTAGGSTGVGPTGGSQARPHSVPTSLPAGTPFDGVAAGSVAGRWMVDGAHIESVIGPARGIVLAAAGTPGHGIAATIRLPSDQVGLAVRVKDAQNLWFLTPVPKFGAWRVAELSGGRVVKSFPIALLGTKEGTEAALVTKGQVLSVVVAGRVRLTVTDPDLADQTTVGVVSLAPVGGGWTALRVLP